MQAATLKQSGPAGPPAPFRAGPEDEEDAGRERAARLGILCHRVLQEMDFGKPQVAKLADALAEDPSLAEEAKMILGEFVKTEAFRRIARSKVLARELPFLLKDGETIVQGVIDLLVREPEGLVVVDYKSDEGGAAEEKKEAYGEQRRWYLRAVEEILGAKARFRLVFLRTGQELEG
jgi:ATP-dependent exoDNAse (exonuclease V) beta subunit